MTTLIATLPQKLQSELKQIRSRVGEIATRQRVGHDLPHTHDPLMQADESIQRLETWLLDDEQKQVLMVNPRDAFLLYATTWLCDVDMPISPGAVESTTMVETQDGLVPLCTSASQMTDTQWQALGIDNPDIARTIACICAQAERGFNVQDGIASREVHQVEDRPVNITLLAAAIRLVRDLDLQAPHTAARVIGFTAASTVDDRELYDNAFTVTGMGPHPYLTGTIQLTLQCRNPEIHRALKHYERAVQKQLRQINRCASPRFLYSDILFEIDADGYTPMDLKFSVDTSAALRLLTGNRLYSDNRVFLRELLQNAVDACNLRKRLEPTYEPSISIRFNDDISVVTVRDNGIGMDRQWIEKYFLNIGISLYQSTEVHSADRRSEIDFSFISQFGIGFLSSFLVADKIVIKTRKAGQTGMVISITNLRDYFDVRPMADDFEPGTEVSLHLKPSKINYCRSLEYAGYLKTNIRFLDVPVVFRDQSGKVTNIGCDQLSYDNPQTADVDFIAPLRFKHAEGYLLLRAKKNVDHIYTIESARGGVSVFQDGIFITQIETLLPEGARQHVIGRINLKGEEKCALSMDRNRIFWTGGQLQRIKQVIRRGLAAAANRLLESVDHQTVAENTRQSIINHLAIFFDFNEVDDTIHEILCPPLRHIVEKRFRDFVRIHFAHTNRAEGIPEADGYSHQWQRRIVESFRRN